MPACPYPENELDRLSALKELLVLDTPSELLFDDISKLANKICKTPIAFISLMDKDRQWFKSTIGLDGVVETPRDIAFCAYTILENDLFEIVDASKDIRFQDNPLVTGYPFIRFYAGAPIVLPDDKVVGTLSVVDTKPNRLKKSHQLLLIELANYVAQLLLARRNTIQDKHQESSILSAIVKSSDDAIVSKDLNSNVISWNVGAEKVFGYSAGEIVGKPITVLFPQDKLDEEEVFMRSIKSGKSIVHYETTRLKKSGELIDVSVSLAPIRNATGSIIGASKIARDITSRKKSENRILQLSKMYQALGEINQAIIRMGRQEELFPLICKCAVELGGMDLAFIVQIDDAKTKFEKVANYGKYSNEGNTVSFSPNLNADEKGCPANIAFHLNRPVIIQNFATHYLTEHWQRSSEKCNWNSMAAFPIIKNNQSFAVLSVYSTTPETFNEELTNLFTELANDASFALDNFEKETNRIAAEESLQLAASVFESSSEGIIITDTDNVIISVNPAFTKITGYTMAEVMGKFPSILNSASHDDAFYNAIWKQLNQNGHWQGEIWDKRKSGENYPQLVTINTVYGADKAVKTRITMFTDNSQKREAEYKMWKQANFDFLTDLPNRQMFYNRLDHGIKKAQHTGGTVGLLLLDVDHFKEINDSLGHDKGDLLIKEVARRLRSCVREYDTVARLGGDEYTIIIENILDTTELDHLSGLILDAMSAAFKLDEDVIYSSLSIGIAIYPNHANSVETLLKSADQALYVAKRNGRNQYAFFTASMERDSQNRMQTAKDLRSVLTKNELWIAYQPIIDLSTNLITKAEALVRWAHPVKGQINPVDFIPIAEDTGLINEIGEWVFIEATKQVKRWQHLLDPEFQISVNMSPVQFKNSNPQQNKWRVCLEENSVAGKSIVIEITEGLLLDSNPNVKNTLFDFRDSGIQVSIDDFGTGYSALSYIKKFDIDYLKIDKSFIDNITDGADDKVLCEAIIEMAHKLQISVVAEGVETANQVKWLRKIGCDFGQGYLWSKPIRANEFEKFCQDYNQGRAMQELPFNDINT